jgi:hypothetical protein
MGALPGEIIRFMLAAITLYATCIVYSIIRYVAFAPKNVEHIPALITNKGLSMGAALCFSAAFLVQWRGSRAPSAGGDAGARTWFRAGIWGVFLHIPMSLAILEPQYFPEFFLEGGRMHFNGELVFLFGAATAGGIYLLGRHEVTPCQRWWLSLATMTTLFLHIASMGAARGLNINRSHAYMPPMWLVSLVGVGLGIGFLLMARGGGGKDKPAAT